jgi:hypothetical protein
MWHTQRPKTKLHRQQNSSSDGINNSKPGFADDVYYTTQEQRDEAMRAYNIDCESVSAYNTRSRMDKEIVVDK